MINPTSREKLSYLPSESLKEKLKQFAKVMTKDNKSLVKLAIEGARIFKKQLSEKTTYISGLS